MLLGPFMANLLGDFNAAFMLAGEIGLLLLVLEAGHEVDIDMLKMVCGSGTMGLACDLEIYWVGQQPDASLTSMI